MALSRQQKSSLSKPWFGQTLVVKLESNSLAKVNTKIALLVLRQEFKVKQ